MSVVLDISAGVNVQSGLGRYSRSLTEALIPLLFEPPTLFYNHIEGRSEPFLNNLPTRTINLGYKPWRMVVWMGQLAHVGFNRLIPGATLYHGHEHLLMPLRGIPTVLTVHDLIFKLFPEHHKKLNYVFLNQAMPLFCKRADAIITISESSKRDLVEHYNASPDKIHVIYEAPDPIFRPPTAEQIDAVRQRYQLPEQFLLVVGTIEPRKNYSRLVEALMRLRESHSDLKLVVVGSKGWLYDEFFGKIAALNATGHVIFPGFIPDEDLPVVYGMATVVVMASVYEGFGLPILEAMACGTPVVCSSTSSLPELGGDVARYFDPYNVDEMVAAIDALLSDSDLRKKLASEGLLHAAEFTWERTARETIDVYNALLDA
ncbi:MAG: glycosyltransferase family 4 protein, partial [Chloroflexi bacterium]|nr:glycosyltransferase family 4 protein [Chloroflexota bacterium]